MEEKVSYSTMIGYLEGVAEAWADSAKEYGENHEGVKRGWQMVQIVRLVIEDLTLLSIDVKKDGTVIVEGV